MSLPHRTPAQPSGQPGALSPVPEELRFRERLTASPRPVTTAGGRVWRDREMDSPSPLPPLPSRFRCCFLGEERRPPPVRTTKAGNRVAAPLWVTARGRRPTWGHEAQEGKKRAETDRAGAGETSKQGGGAGCQARSLSRWRKRSDRASDQRGRQTGRERRPAGRGRGRVGGNGR